jgi:hypothetical protein
MLEEKRVWVPARRGPFKLLRQASIRASTTLNNNYTLGTLFFGSGLVDEVMDGLPGQKQSPIDKVIRFCLENKLVVGLLVIMFIGWGLMVAPFDWDLWVGYGTRAYFEGRGNPMRAREGW